MMKLTGIVADRSRAARRVGNGVVMVAAVLSLVAGCADPDLAGGAERDEQTGVAVSADIGDRNTGTGNGLDADEYHLHLAELEYAMSSALVDEGDMSKSLLASGLLDTEVGKRVLKYAFQCAAALGETLPGTGPEMTGQQLLATATSWTKGSGGLSTAQQMDVLACVIARVNSTVGVPVLLSGPSIYDVPGDNSEFDVDEAVWLVQKDTNGHIRHHVWNLIPVTLCNEQSAWASLRERICSLLPEQECGFIKHVNLAGECELKEDGYWCNGQPAIATQLRRKDFDVLHPRCGL